MIKRTLYFGNPAYLSKSNHQLLVRLPEVVKNDIFPETFRKEATATIPIEDIGVVVLDNHQVTITQGLLSALLENNVAVVACDDSHHPEGMFLPLDVNTVQHERFKAQFEASVPLQKQLWQQTVEAKIRNQAAMLAIAGGDEGQLLALSRMVRSGDPDNLEARASYHYWGNLFPEELNFRRKRDGDPPNNLLNYGYAILRALMARSLVGSGLLPVRGIHHSNKYNAYCLADDIMEPFRPYVDRIVFDLVVKKTEMAELDTGLKKELLGVCSVDVVIDGERSPLMVGMQRTTASLVRCFEGDARKILYPQM